MNDEMLREVWGMVDRDHLAQVARKGPEPIFATISGAHLYGFASPDSDVDLRGAFMLPARDVLGLHPPDETITIEDKTIIDLDWVAHDIRKFARLMTNHNGYVLEQLYSPLVVVTTPAHEELLRLGRGCITRPTVRHYQGFARGRRHRLAEPDPTVKHLLYAYRVFLSGIHLMQTGEVVANIQVLNERFRLGEVDELVARKRAGAEKMALEERDHLQHGKVLDRLEQQLQAAYDDSRLPEEPTTAAALDQFVVDLRLKAAAPRVMFKLEEHTIFLTLAGSQAHGTARQGSDVDVRGICVVPLPLRVSLFRTFEQYEGELPPALAEQVVPRIKEHPTAAQGLGVKTECVIYDVAKFLSLCAAANPNALEILFASEADWLLAAPAWRRLYDERTQFLTRKVQQTFLGYAMAQLKKIQTHRSWLLNPPTKKPSREDFGLPAHGGTLSADDQNRIEQGIAEKVRSYGIDNVDLPKPARIAIQERLEAFCRDMLAVARDDLQDRLRAVATTALGIPSDVASTLNAEKRYRAALKHWDSYQTWQAQRNPARAELERSHGYDTKHAMHLIRLMRMGLEVLQTGELRVRRDDAEQLSAVRDGALSFDELLAMAGDLQRGMETAAAATQLPPDVDYERVDGLLVELLGAV